MQLAFATPRPTAAAPSWAPPTSSPDSLVLHGRRSGCHVPELSSHHDHRASAKMSAVNGETTGGSPVSRMAR